jgi:hypothetical protein
VYSPLSLKHTHTHTAKQAALMVPTLPWHDCHVACRRGVVVGGPWLAGGSVPSPCTRGPTRSSSASTRVTILAGSPPFVTVATSVVSANSDDGRVVVKASLNLNGNSNVSLLWTAPDLTPAQFAFALLSSPTDANLVGVPCAPSRAHWGPRARNCASLVVNHCSVNMTLRGGACVCVSVSVTPCP